MQTVEAVKRDYRGAFGAPVPSSPAVVSPRVTSASEEVANKRQRSTHHTSGINDLRSIRGLTSKQRSYLVKGVCAFNNIQQHDRSRRCVTLRIQTAGFTSAAE